MWCYEHPNIQQIVTNNCTRKINNLFCLITEDKGGATDKINNKCFLGMTVIFFKHNHIKESIKYHFICLKIFNDYIYKRMGHKHIKYDESA